jgi:F0F1-type ATP synthase membrane subunit c/vacuolar-type H+-ATPase subunit K
LPEIPKPQLLFKLAILAIAFAEAIAIYALVVSLILKFVG